ncbi:hypothetical protein AVEN_378-1 [Araneus ventricosus]|uniref:Uncharacterized protein n=1 Tax=Araneus ventricosus TaxID=182803 RepID=A0A4Y2DRX3_ARAVE|nr:hypothetical protein AVEN_378-1 [Araneus ventricosus]
MDPNSKQDHTRDKFFYQNSQLQVGSKKCSRQVLLLKIPTPRMCGSLMVSYRARGRRVPDSKPDCTKHLLRLRDWCTTNLTPSTKPLPAGVAWKFGERALPQVPSSLSDLD